MSLLVPLGYVDEEVTVVRVVVEADVCWDCDGDSRVVDPGKGECAFPAKVDGAAAIETVDGCC